MCYIPLQGVSSWLRRGGRRGEWSLECICISDLMDLSLAGISVIGLKHQAERFRLVTATKCDENFGRNRRQTGIMTNLVNADGKVPSISWPCWWPWVDEEPWELAKLSRFSWIPGQWYLDLDSCVQHKLINSAMTVPGHATRVTFMKKYYF